MAAKKEKTPICPLCHRRDVRSELVLTKLKPNKLASGDRFPTAMDKPPTLNLTCPTCRSSWDE